MNKEKKEAGTKLENSAECNLLAKSNSYDSLSPIEQRRLSLESLYLILSTATRIGTEKDVPEGSRYIQISETLANRMLATIEAYVAEGWEYLLKS
jgi:hypothetical protein